MKKVFVLGINGSPFNDGKCSFYLKKFLKNSERYGAETEILNLRDKKILPCLGCYSKNPKNCTYPCWQKDDMLSLYPLIEKADALILGTPVYWFNVSGLMKNFIDRLTCMDVNGNLLEGKVGVFISVSKENEGGRLNASLALASSLSHFGLLIPPYGILFYPGQEKIKNKKKIVWKDWFEEELNLISKNLIKLCQFLKKENFSW